MRQRAAIEVFAKRSGFEVLGEFYDAAVSSADPIQGRPGFAALLDRIEGNGVRVVIVEDASRFARQLMTQELGIALLISRLADTATNLDDGHENATRTFWAAAESVLTRSAQIWRTREFGWGLPVVVADLS